MSSRCSWDNGCCHRHKKAPACVNSSRIATHETQALRAAVISKRSSPFATASTSASACFSGPERLTTRPRVAVCYSGLLRSASLVAESHHEHLFRVLGKAGVSYRVFVHSWQETTGSLQSSWDVRARERSNSSDAALFQPTVVAIDDQLSFLEQLPMRWPQLDTLLSGKTVRMGGERNASVTAIARNLLCGLESQKRCLALITAEATANNGASSTAKLRRGRAWRPDFVVFVRPDARLATNFPVQQMLALGTNAALVPHDHAWGGYNDRLAVLCAGHAAHVYGTRIDAAAAYLQRERSLHAEQFLRRVLDSHGVHTSAALAMKVHLVRADGSILHA
jgi:hypothetical protein